MQEENSSVNPLRKKISMNIIIVGSKGKMGKMLAVSARQIPGITIAGKIDAGDDIKKVIKRADVVVDFSSPEATVDLTKLCAAVHRPMVIGTTGHDSAERHAIKNYSVAIPIVMASNFSPGVNTLFWLTRKVAEILGPGFDLEIVEMHHGQKKDAPSGTADALARILAEVRDWTVEEAVRHGRVGLTSTRRNCEIGIHSLRGGDVVGDHTVIFAGPGERVELTHKASSREVFARGALRAAQWVAGRTPGFYDMQDVLGLR